MSIPAALSNLNPCPAQSPSPGRLGSSGALLEADGTKADGAKAAKQDDLKPVPGLQLAGLDGTDDHGSPLGGGGGDEAGGGDGGAVKRSPRSLAYDHPRPSTLLANRWAMVHIVRVWFASLCRMSAR